MRISAVIVKKAVDTFSCGAVIFDCFYCSQVAKDHLLIIQLWALSFSKSVSCVIHVVQYVMVNQPEVVFRLRKALL